MLYALVFDTYFLIITVYAFKRFFALYISGHIRNCLWEIYELSEIIKSQKSCCKQLHAVCINQSVQILNRRADFYENI